MNGNLDLDTFDTDDPDWPTCREDLETFVSLDLPTRHLVLRLLDRPMEEDWQALREHPQSQMLAEWLRRQPAYTRRRPDWKCEVCEESFGHDDDDVPPTCNWCKFERDEMHKYL